MSKLHSLLLGVGPDQHHPKAHAHDGADGSGTIAYGSIVGAPSAAFVPLFLAPGSTFTVPQYVQMLYTIPIDAEGVLETNGVLAEVT